MDPVHVRRRRAVTIGLVAAVGVLALVLTVVLSGLLGRGGNDVGGDNVAGDGAAAGDAPADTGAPDAAGDGDGDTAAEDEAGDNDGGATGDEDAAETEEVTAEPTEELNPLWQRPHAEQEHPSDSTKMVQVDYLTGGLTPKSVMASGGGLMIANNMMYSHTSTVFDSQTREQIEVLSDTVVMEDFGIEGHPGESRGSPVEAVWTADGRYAYVSQYTMYGQNFGVEGFDACTRDSGVGASFVYRFDAEDMAWDQVFRVGAVPKFLALSPDQQTLLVSNWCDASISVVDTELGEETSVIQVNESPRGIEIMPDNRTAYVVAMYGDQLYKVDYLDGTSEVVMDTALRPRHLNLTEDGSTLYMTTSAGNTIFKLDTETDEIIDSVSPGMEPRSVTMSPDESALYVVNYHEASVSKIRTSDMTVIDKVGVDRSPIGIDYDPVTNTVWVACYGGAIYVFDDQDTLL